MVVFLRWWPLRESTMKSAMKKRVLVVDDEAAIVDGVTMLLQFEAIESAGASDRGDALKVMNDAFFDVVITDLCLHSVEEGLQLVDDIRRLSPRSKIMVLSGYVTPEMTENLLRRGVITVLHKPANSETLLAAVQELFAEIVETAGSGETLDLEELYLTVRRSLYSVPRRRFGLTHDQAEDVLQDAWLLFLQKRGLIRSARPWLAGAVVNLSRQTIDRCVRNRAQSEESALLDNHEDRSQGDLGDILAVRNALDQADERTRTLCSLIGLDGMSYEEVSAATGLPLGSIGPLYIRAKKRLRKSLSH